MSRTVRFIDSLSQAQAPRFEFFMTRIVLAIRLLLVSLTILPLPTQFQQCVHEHELFIGTLITLRNLLNHRNNIKYSTIIDGHKISALIVFTIQLEFWRSPDFVQRVSPMN